LLEERLLDLLDEERPLLDLLDEERRLPLDLERLPPDLDLVLDPWVAISPPG